MVGIFSFVLDFLSQAVRVDRELLYPKRWTLVLYILLLIILVIPGDGHTVSGGPIANFSATPTVGTAPLEVAFTDTSTGDITMWIWVFGDGKTSMAQHPTHTYTLPGSYTVHLMVNGPGGVNTATKINYIVTEPPPVAVFSATLTAGDAPLTVAFSDMSSGTVTSWSWDFGDGHSSTAQHPSHTYTTPGTYTVVLTVTGPAGTATDTKSNYVTVTLPAPVAAFSASSTMGAAPLTVAFSDTSSGKVTSWVWDFGDGSSSTAQHPSHTYTAPGIYTVSLTVSSPGGSDTVTRQEMITVLTEVKAAQVRLNWSAPTVSVDDTPLNDLSGFKVYYGQTSGNYTGSIDVGNVTSFALSSSSGFEVGQTYFITVAALDTSGNEGPAANEVSVTIPYAVPIASFSTKLTVGTAPFTVPFADISTGSVSSWFWEFGDGRTNTAQHPSHTYTAPGTYTVSLTVYGPGGAHTVTQASVITAATSPPSPEIGEVQVDHTWKRIAFRHTFVSPVVIATALSQYDAEPAVVRIRHVDTAGFELQVQEWDYLDGMHAPEIVSYFVIEAGNYLLPDGTRIEAGQFVTDKSDFQKVTFQQAFQHIPVVLTTVATAHEADAVTGQIANIDTPSFQYRLREQEANQQLHAAETVSYVAWEPSTGTLGNLTFAVTHTPEMVDDRFYSLPFTGNTSNGIPAFLAQLQTTSGMDTASLRWRHKGASEIDIRVAEEQSADNETRHKPEVVGYMLFFGFSPDTDGDGVLDVEELHLYNTNPEVADTDSDGLSDGEELQVYGTDPMRADTDGDGLLDGAEVAQWGTAWVVDADADGVINLLDPDADNDGLPDGTERHYNLDPGAAHSRLQIPPLEVGEVRVNHTWTWVPLQHAFFDPIVLATSMSQHGTDPAVVRIRNVDATGFEIRVQEWNYLDGIHAPETIGYLVMERGSYTLADGTRLEAGQFVSEATSGFQRVLFERAFQHSPVVLTTVGTVYEAEAVVGQIRTVGKVGFYYRLREQEANAQQHAAETIFYLAWEPSAGQVGSLTFEVGKTPPAVTQQFYPIVYTETFANIPVFLAHLQTTNEEDPSTLRWRDQDFYGLKVGVKEERSADSDIRHPPEMVGYILCAIRDDSLDSDGDSLTNIDELTVYMTNPGLVDTDGDGLADGEESQVYGTDPAHADTDGDGLPDRAEVAYWGAAWMADADDDGVINLLDPDADNDGLPDGTERHYSLDPGVALSRLPVPPLEVGEVRVNHLWKRVPLQHAFFDPIVVATAMSQHGTNPAIVRLRNVDATGFEIRVQEWEYQDGVHTTETIGYLVLERGSYTLANGVKIEAGRFVSDATSGFQRVVFDQPFQKIPVVLTAVATVHEADAVVGQIRVVGRQEFRFRLREQERNPRQHAAETVSYIAWEPSAGQVGSMTFEVGKTPLTVTQQFYPIISPKTAFKVPIFLAHLQTTYNVDASTLRWRNKDYTGVEVRIVEEQSKDAETLIIPEVVGYMLIW